MGDALAKLEAAAWRAVVPLYVTVELTRRCNLNCDHCYVDHHIKDQLSVEQLDKIFADVARAGGLFLGFTGGEVGLRKDLHEIIAAARQYRFNVKLLSTATLFSQEDIERLAASGVRQVKVSIYSASPAVHDRVVRRAGAHALSLRGIRRLLDAGIEVTMACPIMRENKDEIASIVALADSLGIRAEFDGRVNPMENGGTDPCSLRITAGELAASFNAAPGLAEYLMKGGSSWENGGLLPPRDPDEHVCSAGNTLCFIDSRGDVFPCVWWREKIGNALSDGFYELWKTSRVFARIRQFKLKDLHECQDCSLQQHCSVCPGVGYQERGDAALAGSSVCNTAAANKLFYDYERHRVPYEDPGYVVLGATGAKGVARGMSKRTKLPILG
ncbi:MAG: radical SAM protein [Deltaproteobacteria bacterium]|nr:radical SAM protein [Deltaproteobacteria bacterium]